MNTKMQEVLEEARQLPPLEQLELIRELSESLQSLVGEGVNSSNATNPNQILRTKPATNLDEYAADFWPEDESLDDLDSFIRQSRAADRLSDQ